jgi:hypothetical protein
MSNGTVFANEIHNWQCSGPTYVMANAVSKQKLLISSLANAVLRQKDPRDVVGIILSWLDRNVTTIIITVMINHT